MLYLPSSVVKCHGLMTASTQSRFLMRPPLNGDKLARLRA